MFVYNITFQHEEKNGTIFKCGYLKTCYTNCCQHLFFWELKDKASCERFNICCLYCRIKAPVPKGNAWHDVYLMSSECSLVPCVWDMYSEVWLNTHKHLARNYLCFAMTKLVWDPAFPHTNKASPRNTCSLAHENGYISLYSATIISKRKVNDITYYSIRC